ncbi:DUF5677 domain-containing protein [Clostridium sp. ZBS4]|uniref:DUF5677 domain-containing protein n=1 Tax=Clostridium sp. ZBS4 TaxID=2949974 RepID=UPI002079B6C6
MKRRALSYDAENLYRKITYYEKMNVNNEEYAEFREIVGEGVADNFDSEDMQKRINNLKSIFDKYPEYKEIKEERERTISHNMRRYRNKTPRWYELFDGPKSIYQLSKTLNMEKYYITLYEVLSNKSHGSNVMNGIDILNGNVCVENPKVPSPSKLSIQISLLSTFLEGMYFEIVKNMLDNEDGVNFGQWHFELRKREKLITDKWKNVKYKSK